MTSNPIIILGSSRSFGETRKAIETVIGNKNIPIIDLKTLKIAPYDYEYRNKDDDYLPLIEKIVTYDLIVIATPVYWYTMSAVTKTFIDRLSDLLDTRKDLGRQLRNKKLFIIASYNTSLPKGFEDTFEQTCHYLGIQYQGCSFIYNGEDPNLKKKSDADVNKAKKMILETFPVY